MTRILLVIEDEPAIASLFRRRLGVHFEELHLVRTRSDAEAILERVTVTHVVCDFHLGPQEPPASARIGEWRARWPAIRYTAMLSGSQLVPLSGIPGIDEVFLKPAGFESLVERLSQR